MKITVNQLRKIIKEEISRVMNENESEPQVSAENLKKLEGLFKYHLMTGKSWDDSLALAFNNRNLGEPSEEFKKSWEETHPRPETDAPARSKQDPLPRTFKNFYGDLGKMGGSRHRGP
jgi:hypothetical protein